MTAKSKPRRAVKAMAKTVVKAKAKAKTKVPAPKAPESPSTTKTASSNPRTEVLRKMLLERRQEVMKEIKATMPVEGDYFDLVRFINRLERSERFFLVEQITIAQRESNETGIELGCSIAFFLKAAAVQGSAASKAGP